MMYIIHLAYTHTFVTVVKLLVEC